MRLKETFIGLTVIAFTGLSVVACQNVPVTGRPQLSLFSDAQILSLADSAFAKFTTIASQQNLIMREDESPLAANTINMIKSVSDQIIEASGLRGRYAWEVIVVKSNQRNAFVLPNGKIVIYSGILPIAQNPSGLAAVISHEVSHVAAHHGAERMSQALLANVATSAAAAALAANNNKNAPIINAALGMGIQFGVLLPYSRAHESEADRLGLIFMAKAGFDPTEALALWQRMEAAQRSQRAEYLSTHPSASTRQSQISQWLPEARAYFSNPNLPLPANLVELRNVAEEAAVRAASSPLVNRPPAPKPGDWTSSSTDGAAPIRSEFSGVQNCGTSDCYVFNNSDGDIEFVTFDLALREQRKKDGAWTRYSPAIQIFRWPLRVGDTWSQSVVSETSSGRRRQVLVKVDVLRYEEVRVRDSTYEAVKLSLSMNGSRIVDYWYAPAVGGLVRTERSRLLGLTSVTELAASSFQPPHELVE